jgi:hypothetical protein
MVVKLTQRSAASSCHAQQSMSQQSMSLRRWLVPFATLALAGPASAVQFKLLNGEVEGAFDSTFSVGATFRTQDPSDKLLANQNGNDGNGRFDAWDAVYSPVKGTHELQLTAGNYRAFVRTSYFYDAVYDHEDMVDGAQDRAVAKISLLDAFLQGRWFLSENHLLNWRLGNQVISWGESTYIGGSLNDINTTDLTKLRLPGSELKEALLPTPALWASINISRNASIEAFYLFGFTRLRLDPRGTFFSTNDFISSGGREFYAGPATLSYKGKDLPSDHGQYGVAARYLAENLGDTEFSVYFMNLHNHAPIVAGMRGGAGESPGYLQTFPESNRLYGLGINSHLGGAAVQGEYSYRPNKPLQENDFVAGALGMGAYASLPPGAIIPSVDRRAVSQAQATVTYAFGPTASADQLMVVFETAINRTHNVPTWSSADQTAWGYNGRATMTWNNLYRGANFAPYLAHAHDVNGTSADGTFIDGRKSVAVGLTVDYMLHWQADISYTNYMGKLNPIFDRDIMAVTLSYAF